ncbi:ATP-grasp domain-containing protein [Verrucomicrobiota bacterium sgz303538]
MFTRAFLEETGNGKLRHEERLLRSEFDRRGIPVTLYTSKRIQRRQLPLTSETFIAGDMDAMHGAMRQLKIEVPVPNDYPKSLESFLCRRVWRSTLGAVEKQVIEGNGQAIFVKPADRRKNFTGRIFESIDDFREIGDVSRHQEVWCSEVVAWAAEYRVYVLGDQILSIDLYAGSEANPLDQETVQAAIAAYRASGEAKAAYGIDFGVLTTGQTALVEANDGYSLGAYQISAHAYADLLIARWLELVSTITKPLMRLYLRIIRKEGHEEYTTDEKHRLHELLVSVPGIEMVRELSRHPRGGYSVIVEHTGDAFETLVSYIESGGYRAVF